MTEQRIKQEIEYIENALDEGCPLFRINLQIDKMIIIAREAKFEILDVLKNMKENLY